LFPARWFPLYVPGSVTCYLYSSSLFIQFPVGLILPRFALRLRYAVAERDALRCVEHRILRLRLRFACVYALFGAFLLHFTRLFAHTGSFLYIYRDLPFTCTVTFTDFTVWFAVRLFCVVRAFSRTPFLVYRACALRVTYYVSHRTHSPFSHFGLRYLFAGTLVRAFTVTFTVARYRALRSRFTVG